MLWSQLAAASLAQEAAAPDELVVIDLRPKEEKEGFGLSPLDGKCNKDVFRIADVASDPLKVDVLKAGSRRSSWASAGDGKTLTVLNWSIYYNKQTQRAGESMLESVGIQGYSDPCQEKEKQGRQQVFAARNRPAAGTRGKR